MEIIAEIGQNHNGEMNLAIELIHAAKECGADVAKFQVYDARALFPKEGNEWFEYNCKTELSREQLMLLSQECKKVDIEFMASVFDVERVGWLEECGVERYKVASRSVKDAALIDAIAATGKPILVSLGMWDGPEFPQINGSAKVDFLYCVSKYPTPLEDLKLAHVDFAESYAGFSDHSEGITAAIVACSRGARILEKHFTLDQSMYGPDHVCSMCPKELTNLHRIKSEILRCL
ncbi:MAG: N-acetylneuraminate synthase family protein [Bdellovibrionales bacterium]|nr:N-acetylneuraminate synthase family protein [Bdellovibrionales bacterium]